MLENKPNTRNQYVAALIATGACVSSGMSFGWPSPVELQIVADTNGTCSHEFCVSRSEFAWIATMMTVGAIVFGFFGGPLMSVIGRKRALMCYYIVIFGGWLSLLLANAKWMLYLGRTLIGAGYGGTCVIVPVYLGEIALASNRGGLTALVLTKMATGTMIVYILGYFFQMFTQNLVSTVIVAVYGLALFIIPESPSYYISKDKKDDANSSLKWLRGQHYDPEKEIEEIIVFQNGQQTTGIKAFFRESVNRKAMLIASGLFIGFELSGMNAVLFYTTSIFEEADIGIEASLAVVFAGLCTFAGPPLAILLVDRVGRKILLLTSFFVMCACFIVMGTYFQMQLNDPESVLSWRIVPVVVLCLYIFMNSFGCSPVSFILLGEIFAQNVKDVAAGLTMTLAYIVSMVVTIGFPYLSETIGTGGAFFIFSAFNAITFVFIWIILPETKGKTFAEIQLLLTSKKK